MSKPFRCASIVAALIVSSLAAAPALAGDRIKQPAKSAAKPAPAKPAFTVADATPDQVKAAELVFYGAYDCEFKQTVSIAQSPKYSGYVDVKHGPKAWLMKPVLSSTGAIRLEDVRGETLMVQIASKSMLLNVKTAQRLVDDCVCAKQREMMAEANAAKAAAEAAPIKAATDAGTVASSPLLK